MPRPRPRIPCSDQSLARNDPMYGTASAGSSWMLLELCGGWGHSAFLNSPAASTPNSGAQSFAESKRRACGSRRYVVMVVARPHRDGDGSWPSPAWAARRCTPVRRTTLATTWTLRSTEPTARYPPIRLWPSARTASMINVVRFAGAALPRRSPTVPRNHLGMFPSGWRSLCRDHARPTGRACVTGGWTPPIRPNSSVCISTADWTTGFSGAAPRYRMPCKPHNISPAEIRRRPHRQPVAAGCRTSEGTLRVVLKRRLGARRSQPQRGALRAAAVAMSGPVPGKVLVFTLESITSSAGNSTI